MDEWPQKVKNATRNCLSLNKKGKKKERQERKNWERKERKAKLHMINKTFDLQ